MDAAGKIRFHSSSMWSSEKSSNLKSFCLGYVLYMFHVGFSFAQAGLSVCIESPPEKEKTKWAGRTLCAAAGRVLFMSGTAE